MGTLADANPTRLSKQSQGCPLTTSTRSTITLLTCIILMTLEINTVTSKFSKQCQFLDMLIMSYIAIMAIALALTIFIPPLQESVRHYPYSCLSF